MKPYHIRLAQHSDAEAIINAHVRSIKEICSKDYTGEQIAAWAGRNFKTSQWCQTIDRDFVCVVEMNSIVLGFGHLAIMDTETAEIMGLYFAPDLCGKGAGKELMHILKNQALDQACSRVQLHSTLTAKSFYESFGFQIVQETSIEMRGVAIPCFYMECFL